MRIYTKFAMLALPLSLSLVSHLPAAEAKQEIVAHGGGGAAHGVGGVGHDNFGRDANFGHDANLRHDGNLYRDGYNNGYNTGGGGYYNGGYGGYGPVLLPDPINSDQDVDSIYNQNLRNMRQTGQ